MRYAIGLIGALLVAGATALPLAQTTPSLQGAWRVTEIVVTGANAATNKSPQPGLYVFTGQHYSIITVNAERKNVGNVANAGKLTDAEKMARYEAWAAR